MTIKETLNNATLSLAKKNIKTARLDAEVLLMHILKKSKEWLYINNDLILSPREEEKYKKIIAARQKRKPVSYLTNNKEFFGLNFYVNENVLTPRPETEKLIELALLKMLKTKGKIEIAEIGIGSGCISTILALKLLESKRQFSIYATDISKKAIDVANKNLKNLKAKKYVKVNKEDILETKKKFDFIISNPPYIPKSARLEKELDFEPDAALFPKKGFMDKFLENALSHLKKGGILLLEIDPSWKTKINSLKNNTKIESIKFEKDLRQLTRYAIIKKRLF